MKLYSSNENYKLYQGNMLDMLEVIEPNSIDSIITDPPYELNFMSKGWDNVGVSFQTDTWKKCYDVLKDGGYLLAFGGSRTFHRIACAIEDAGFEIRDTIMWLYGSGFPKSMNIGLAIDKKNGVESKIVGTGKSGKKEAHTNSLNLVKNPFGGEYEIKEVKNQWQGWGSCLKPSFEPIIVARKPFKGSLVDNIIKNGVGGINIDECRVKTTDVWHRKKAETNTAIGYQRKNKSMYAQKSEGEMNENGRFPANTILTYDETDFEEVCGGFPQSKGKGHFPKNNKNGSSLFNTNKLEQEEKYLSDSGSTSRYFYNAKASKKDRDEGLDEFENNYMAFSNQAKAELKRGNVDFKGNKDNPLNFVNSVSVRKNIHPTVKPTDLMQYLVRLVTPNGGIILDPFNGSGSTGKAVMYENKERSKNYKYIGIELTEEYLPISKARIEYVCNLIEKEKKEDKQISIFDELEG